MKTLLKITFILILINIITNSIILDLKRNNNHKDLIRKSFFETAFSDHDSLESFIRSNLDKPHIFAKHSNNLNKYWHSYQNKIAKFNDDVELNVKTEDDLQFHVNVEIGTPGQTFNLQIDTGSSDLWVPTTECETEYCKSTRLYNSSMSSTYSKTDAYFTIIYGQGSQSPSEVSGIVSKDDISLGNLKLKSYLFGEVTNSKYFEKGTEGILGLGFSEVSRVGSESVIIKLAEEKLIDKALFSFYLSKANNREGSKLILGAVNPAYFQNEIHYYPLTKKGFWIFKIDGLSVNDQLISYKTAFLDSGTSAIYTPISVYDQLTSLIGNVNKECIGIEKLPVVHLIVEGNKFPITSAEYIFEYHKKCHYFFIKGNIKFIVLGDVFMKAYYTVFDYENSRIGFALSANIE